MRYVHEGRELRNYVKYVRLDSLFLLIKSMSDSLSSNYVAGLPKYLYTITGLILTDQHTEGLNRQIRLPAIDNVATKAELRQQDWGIQVGPSKYHNIM